MYDIGRCWDGGKTPKYEHEIPDSENENLTLAVHEDDLKGARFIPQGPAEILRAYFAPGISQCNNTEFDGGAHNCRK